MTKPHCAQRGPFVQQVQPGTYAWCACGLSKKQPFCDGAHAPTGIVPVVEKITAARQVAWCGCKSSLAKPFCDGAHARLPPG